MDPAPRIVSWTPVARYLLDQALDYVAGDSIEAALALLDDAERIADSLATMSERGSVVRRFVQGNVHQVFVQSYRMIYRVRDDAVDILAFVHTSRDFERWLRARK